MNKFKFSLHKKNTFHNFPKAHFAIGARENIHCANSNLHQTAGRLNLYQFS